MTKPIVRDPIYRRRRLDAEIIELCVRWYVTYRPSYRDLVATMGNSLCARIGGAAFLAAIGSFHVSACP
jgi:hypothetical protein